MAPSHASAPREGGGEALTGGVQAGLLSSEITTIGSPTSWSGREGSTVRRAIASGVTGPAESENQGMYASSMHGNREIRGSTDRHPRSARSGQAKADIPTCTVPGSRTEA